jgi:PAS domain S-box-containing protein
LKSSTKIIRYLPSLFSYKINRGVLIGYLSFSVLTYLLLSSARNQYREIIASSHLSSIEISQKLKLLDSINRNSNTLYLYILQFRLDSSPSLKNHRKYSIDSINAKNTVLLEKFGETISNPTEKELFEHFKMLKQDLSETREVYLLTIINHPSANPESGYSRVKQAFQAFKTTETKLLNYEHKAFLNASKTSANSLRKTVNKVEIILLGFILISLMFCFISLKLFFRLKKQYLSLKNAIQEKERATSYATAILNALPANVALLDKTGKIIEVNYAWKYFMDESLGNYGIGENLLEELKKTIPEKDSKEFIKYIIELIEGKKDKFSLVHSLTRSGYKKWFRVTAGRESNSVDSGVIVMYLDITDKKEAEEKTKQAEARLIEFSENSQDVICSIDEDGNFVQVSKAAYDIWGYRPVELRGKKYIKFVHEQDQAMTIEVANNIMQGNAVTMFENRYTRKDGATVPMLWSARWKEDEKIMYCIARNATEKKAAEEKLKKAEANYREIFEKGSDGIFILDPKKNTFIQANQKSFEIIGSSKERILNQPISEILSLPQQNTTQTIDQKIKEGIEGEGKVFEWEIQHEDLSRHWIELNCSLAYIAEKEKILIFFHNIDDRKEVELANAKITNDLALRNLHLQEFAYMVSHNLRAPVASILGLLNLLEGELSESEKIKTQRFLHTSVDQLDGIVKHLNTILELRIPLENNAIN